MENLIINPEMSEGLMIQTLENFIKEFGLGFHPDTDAKEYVKWDTNKPVFTTDEQCAIYDDSLSILFNVFGDELYHITVTIFSNMEG